MRTEPAAGAYQVEGRIFFDHGLPAGQLPVRLYHRGYGCTAKLLGDTQTADDGSYNLSYSPSGNLLNLEVRTVDDKETEVSLSGIRYGAQNHEIFNLVAPAWVQPLAPEFNRLLADLELLLREGGTLGDAQENPVCQDITLLHQATKWDARLIALLALAAQLNRETGLGEKVLYALLRNGLPSDKKLLAHISLTVIEEALNKAVEANIVSLTAQNITAAKQAFQTFAREIRRTTKAVGAPSSFAELLDKSGLTQAQKLTFESVYFNHKGSAVGLWATAEQEGIPSEQIKRLQLQGKLAYLTLNNAALAEEIRGEMDSPEKLGGLIEKDLYRQDEWQKRLVMLSGENESKLEKLIPPAYKGVTIAERLESYSADLARKVRLTFPTRVVARMIENDELHLGPQHSALKAPVNTLLKNAEALGFSLGRVPINAFLAQNKNEVFDGIEAEDVEAATSAFKKLNRLYQITPTNEAFQLALSKGFTSAADVVAVPYESFMSSYGDKFSSDPDVSANIANIFYRKAQQVSSVTHNFFMSAKQMESAPPVYAMSPPDSVLQEAKSEFIKHYPTMETLFGSLDFCECEACRSVLSPAAYLVDLLQFLNPGEGAWNSFQDSWKSTHNNEEYTAEHMKAYDALVERRPDIPHLPLTCENTHTVLPYIDVVNEILEYYVAKGSLDSSAVRDTGEAASADLLAEPQNILTEAYEELKGVWYPIGLPFDLWLETVRRFCDHFGLPLWQVLEIFRSTEKLFSDTGDPESYDWSDIFLESLNLSPTESEMITSADPLDKWHLLYGFDDGGNTEQENKDEALTKLASAKTLARRLGVSYKQLIELLRTGFVNPQLDALVVLQKLGVEVGDVFTYKNNQQLLQQSTLTAEEAALVKELEAFQDRLDEMAATFEFDAVGWLDQAWEDNLFDKALVLADPDTGCNFDATTLRYADGTSVDALALIKLNLIVRLWKKFGWTIEETDRALQTFLPSGSLPLTAASLGEALKTALIYLAQFKRLDEQLKVGTNRRLKLLTLWSNLPTTGSKPLYAQLFLSKSVLKQDAVFDDPLGNYLLQSLPIKDHVLALQAALSLTANEIAGILADVGQKIETANLSLENVSMLYRYGLLAKALKLSVQELITLKSLSGLDPFKPLSPDPLVELEDVYPLTQTLRFVDVAAMVKESGFRIEELDYFFRHRFDPVGKYQQNPDSVLGLVKRLAAELERIRDEQAIAGSPTDDQLKQKLALVLTPDVLTAFFAAITGSAESEVSQFDVDPDDMIDPKSFADEPRIHVIYNEVEEQQRLTWRGLMTDAKKDQLKDADDSPVLAPLLELVQPLGFTSLVQQTESVLSALIATTEYHAVLDNVEPSDKLNPKADAFAGEPSIRVAYDETRKIQHLTWRGLLLNAKKKELTDDIPSTVLAQLLDSVQSQVMTEARALISGSLAMLISTIEFHAVKEDVQLADKLDQNSFDPRFSVSYDDAPPWNSLIQYEPDDVVSFNVANWMAKGANKDVQPVNSEDWSGPLSNDGAALWDSSTQYQTDNPVSFNDVKWVAKRANKNVKPVNSVDWAGPHGRRQTLSVRGLLSNTKENELKAKIQSQALPPLLANIKSQIDDFSEKLRVGLLAETGPDDDFDELFAELPSLSDATEDPRARLAYAVKPFIMRHLTRQLVVQTVSTSLDANPDLIEALLTDGSLLLDPSEPGSTLMDAFASAGDKGVSATFFASVDGSGTPLETKVGPTVDTEGMPSTAKSARFEGYLQVPSAGPYRFFALLQLLDAEVEMRLGSLPDPLMLGKADTGGAEFSAFVELKQGLLNVFTFHARNLQSGSAELLVQGENLPKGALSQLSLVPSQSVERVRRATVLLEKSLAIINGLVLTEREVRYLLTHASDFGGVGLNKLPTSDTDVAQAQDLFKHFLRLVQYSRLKRDVAGETDDLIGIFENARRITSSDEAKTALFVELCRRFADLTRREFELVHKTATALTFDASLLTDSPAFAHEQGLGRLWDALRAVETLGVSLDAVTSSTGIIDTTKSEAERFIIASSLRNMVKARYEIENWRRIAQPIFDKLRQRQRDALVAWIMHRNNFERIEQLFEHFLIDPGMEPVVQTSRLRLAISSVQLFIQRSLLNLELKVDPSAINARHWEWMKRYRVWEANRKIFLFPENWLEPEFRDDKTHIFKELESALLEGDVSSDLVEEGFLNYLKKLEELSRLDIVAEYCEETLLDPASNIVHVVGRTFSLPHKYFYRRYQYRMWTPWEPVPVEIDGDHLVLTMWRGRLCIFWVTFLEKAKPNTSGDTIKVDYTTSIEVPTMPERQIDIQLSWCERFQGQWTERESSGFSRPMTVDVTPQFSKRGVFISAFKEYDAEGEEAAVMIQLCGDNNYFPDCFTGPDYLNTAFRVVSKHTPPEVVERDPSQPHFQPYIPIAREIVRFTSSDSLMVHFTIMSVAENDETAIDTPAWEKILNEVDSYSTVLPGEPARLIAPQFGYLTSPFFFQDRRHTFFVEPTLTEETTVDWEDWTIPVAETDWNLDMDNVPITAQVPEWLDPGGPVIFDSLAQYEIGMTADWTTANQTLLQYDEAWVGMSGGVNVQTLPAMSASTVAAIENLGNQFNPPMVGPGGLNAVALSGIKGGSKMSLALGSSAKSGSLKQG